MYRIYTKREYLEYLTQTALGLGKGDKITLATMTFSPEVQEINQLADALCHAAKSGADVTLQLDAYSFIIYKSKLGPLLIGSVPSRLFGRIFNQRRTAINALKDSGVNAIITNRPTKRLYNPFGGRSHIKWAIINNLVLTGGCNLSDPDQDDLMISWEDPKLAKTLTGITNNFSNHPTTSKSFDSTDRTININSDTNLLLDAGVKHQSLILDSAVGLIDAADKSVVFTCQFFPRGKILQSLQSAHDRGVDVKIIYNHPSQHTFPFNLLHYWVKHSAKAKGAAKLFSYERNKSQSYLHSKIILTDKAVMIGSHNYVDAGVDFGTSEVSILSTNPQIKKAIQPRIKQRA